MAAQPLAIVCAWCNRIVVAAPSSGTAITHTICPACLDWALTHPNYVPPPAGWVGTASNR